MPAGHDAMHVAAPAGLKVPLAHAVQVATEVAPVAVENVPAGQLQDVAPAEL